MTDNARACPFCGGQHPVAEWREILEYEDDGSVTLGDTVQNVNIDCHAEHVMIPIDVWDKRPIEDAQAAEIKKLQMYAEYADIDRSMALALTEKDAEIERLTEQLTAARTTVDVKQVDIEHLNKALDRIINMQIFPNEYRWSDMVFSIQAIARAAREREEKP